MAETKATETKASAKAREVALRQLAKRRYNCDLADIDEAFLYKQDREYVDELAALIDEAMVELREAGREMARKGCGCHKCCDTLARALAPLEPPR